MRMWDGTLLGGIDSAWGVVGRKMMRSCRQILFAKALHQGSPETIALSPSASTKKKGGNRVYVVSTL